jgi:hypothetical protein
LKVFKSGRYKDKANTILKIAEYPELQCDGLMILKNFQKPTVVNKQTKYSCWLQAEKFREYDKDSAAEVARYFAM